MYVPILSHFNFKVNYHASQVKVNTWFHGLLFLFLSSFSFSFLTSPKKKVRLHVTDPIHLDRSVDQMEADLAVWVRNSLGTESEYEMVQDHEKRGCFIAKVGKQNKTKQNKTKQNKTKQNKTKQNKTKQSEILFVKF